MTGRRTRAAWLRRVALVVSLVLVASACGDDDDSADPEEEEEAVRGGSISITVGSDPTTYDVIRGCRTTTFSTQMLAVYDTLWGVDPISGEPIPRLALSVEPNSSNTVWTVKLRPNVKFSDGTPFDSAAVKATWDRHARPEVGSTSRSQVDTFASVATPDPLTVVVTLKTASGSFPGLLLNDLGCIPSPTAVQKFGANYGSTPEMTVGAGPFIFTEWVRNGPQRFVRNPNYWDTGKPYLDQLTMTAITDRSQITDGLLTNTFQLGNYNSNDEHLQRALNSGLEGFTLKSLSAYGAWFNPAKAPLDDVRVRRALVLATDAKDVNNKATGGFSAVAAGEKGLAWYPEDSPFYDEDVAPPMPDLAAAQKLIDAYVAEKGPVSFTLLMPQSLQALGEALLQSWNRLNNVRVQAEIQVSAQVILSYSQGNFQAGVTLTPGFEYVDEATQGSHTWYSKSPSNVLKYSNPTMDKLIEEGRVYSDIDKRKEYLNKMADVILEDAIYVRVYYGEASTLGTDDVGNKGEDNLLKGFTLDFANVYRRQ